MEHYISELYYTWFYWRYRNFELEAMCSMLYAKKVFLHAYSPYSFPSTRQGLYNVQHAKLIHIEFACAIFLIGSHTGRMPIRCEQSV